ncbi:MAG: hypothetical protein C4581_09820 [Nitrospiraceae bacterium]|nr:MAG: hypothetical protein C4581_09820 [Nitrospiraceae bacterium]
MLNDDYKEILQNLSKNKVKFLVVGAYAMGVHGYPRATGDLDIWVDVSPDNSELVYKSLVEFGAPLSHINRDTFIEEGIVLQIGIAPRRIDIITQIDGVDFRSAYAEKLVVELEGLAIPFLSRDDLIRNKESTGREKDRVDVQYLKNASDK